MPRRWVFAAIAAGVAVAATVAAAHLHGHKATHARTSSAAAGPSSSREAEHDESQAKAPSFSSLSPSVSQPIVISSGRHDTSPALRTIAPGRPAQGRRDEGPENPARPIERGPQISGRDPVLQTRSPNTPMPALGASFDGVTNLNGVLPPDTNGDVGPTQYVQTVNLSFAVFNKTGAVLYGPANINTLFSGFGGPCQNTNDGDPIVQYDQLADRWLISQLALPNYPNGPFYQCFAVSTTGNATGSYYRYQFQISDAVANLLNDYPKIGVWPDAYYASFNDFKAAATFTGVTAVAFERSRMLIGASARAVSFVLGSAFYSMLPSDLDGSSLPPSGTPNYFVQMDDDGWGYPQDQLEVWKFHVDWTNTSSSTFTADPVLAAAAFDSNLADIPQPSTSVRLDALSDRLMYRLAYRNFGSYQAMVVTHSVDVNGANLGGLRWYELRRTSGAFSINQQGTYSPDTTNRWMGSAAMDQNGDIALGYSAGSSSLFPSIFYAGRLPGDPAGTLSMESTLKSGTGSQTHAAARWGDYSSISVDPTDGCTFWYTSEYLSVTGASPWRTRVGSFRFPSCGATTATIAFRSSSTGSNSVASTLAVSKPSAVVSGDVLLAQIDSTSSTAVTPPAGWTLVRSDVHSSVARQSVYFRVAGSSEPGSYTWTLSASHGAVGAILAYSGVDTVNPIDASGGATSAGSASITAPSVTTTVANAMLVGLYGMTGQRTITPPGSFTERSEVFFGAVPGEKITGESADLALGVAGPTGNKVATANAAGNGIGQLVALRPGQGAPSNHAPTATVGLNTTSPTTNAVLTATATKSDVDGDAVTLTYVWTVNGVVKKTTAATSSLTDAFDLGPAGNGDSGDVITVAVTPNDGTVDGTVVSASATVVGSSAIVFRSASSAENGLAASLALPRPAGVIAGDVLLAVVDVIQAPAVTAPAGWALVRSDVNPNGGQLRQSVYVHVAGASEPASYTWAFAASHGASGGIVTYSGVDTASPVDVSGGQSVTSAALITAPSVTTTVAGAALVGFFGAQGQRSMTPPGGMGERFEVALAAPPGEKVTSEAADQVLSSAGATGTRAANPGSVSTGIGQLIALRPGP